LRLADFSYPLALVFLSLLVAALEHFFPWRKQQKQLRPHLLSDLLHLVFNGHFLGVFLYGIAANYVLPPVDRLLAAHGLLAVVYRNLAAAWPLWAQLVVILFAMDFVQWCVHNLLHRVPLLWELHKTHHSVVDGEMDFLVSFRFQWTEVVVYKVVQYLPLAFFGFSAKAVLIYAIIGTLVGHLNHANLNLGHGAWTYLINSPRMHIWHHDYAADGRTTVNFGIIFSLWDWLFGTAYLPAAPPARLGFRGEEEFPRNFFAQEAWPLPRLLPARARSGAVAAALGVAVVGALFLAHRPPRRAAAPPAAPARSPAEATAALADFGRAARAAGYAHPEYLVSVAELAAALRAPQLVLLDIRPEDRFLAGHIPSARRVDRTDYSEPGPVPGMTRQRAELEALLRARGVRQDSIVLVYTDGGPEAFRLFWSLQAVSALKLRVLDGGLQAWKAAGQAVVSGPAGPVTPGDVVLSTPEQALTGSWQEVAALLREPTTLLLDGRSRAEYRGDKQHPEAVRSGHIPGAQHLYWQSVLRSESDPRLRPVDELRLLFQPFAIEQRSHIVTACQSGTRSAAMYFALLQLGVAPRKLLNYNGSWAEYSRLGLPLQTGDTP
jgi:3-mercaptopyruvate sulfurtransferase SseA/sterol desaturase/sphingolipid hydroxylase (fatty acid hydroxylase superfamily)